MGYNYSFADITGLPSFA